ncbi:MAG: hypothetical protein AVDCRST_MAG88-4628 [uncultured Thermomicrobiales bacterium]|uniref:Uncharacterized protein n=1 Tax=uncultured Thermomicrobiales bacterium TaxID=1645740 RepID=A0A6J4VVK0_9BACT|nr:MAG: hypothetical protein AVDCRST_MAG88-4628 [uncultured Thermomicrobiales bacterium]
MDLLPSPVRAGNLARSRPPPRVVDRSGEYRTHGGWVTNRAMSGSTRGGAHPGGDPDVAGA